MSENPDLDTVLNACYEIVLSDGRKVFVELNGVYWREVMGAKDFVHSHFGDVVKGKFGWRQYRELEFDDTGLNEEGK